MHPHTHTQSIWFTSMIMEEKNGGKEKRTKRIGGQISHHFFFFFEISNKQRYRHTNNGNDPETLISLVE